MLFYLQSNIVFPNFSVLFSTSRREKYRITMHIRQSPKRSSTRTSSMILTVIKFPATLDAQHRGVHPVFPPFLFFSLFFFFLFFSFFLNCIYWLEAIESNWMKQPVIYERLSGANYLSIHSVLSLHSFIIHSRPVYGRCMYSSSKGPFNWSVIV